MVDTIFKMMEPHKKIRVTLNLNNLMEIGELAQNNGTLPCLNHHWQKKRMICWHNMIGCCKNPKCRYDHVPKQKNLDNACTKNVCDVFRELVKWITNHDTRFPGAQTEGNGGPRGGNGGNSGNGRARGNNERCGGKNNKNENTGQSGFGGRNQNGPQGGGSGGKLQCYQGRASGGGMGIIIEVGSHQ